MRWNEFTRNKLDDDLVRLWWERKLTTIFVTHSIYEAVFLSTRIIVMAAHPGRIFRTMTIDQPQPRDQGFRDSPKFAAYCRELSTWLAEASLPSAGAGIMKPLLESEAFVRIAAPIAVGLVLFALWEVGFRMASVPVYLFPKPSDIFTSLLHNGPSLTRALLVTLRVTLQGPLSRPSSSAR